MALSKEEIALYAYVTGRVLPKYTTRRAFNLALAGVIGASKRAAPVAARGALSAAQVAAANPYLAGVPLGVGVGLGSLETPPGQALLEASAESGRQARRDLEFALDFAETSVRSPSMRARAKKKVSNYNRAVKVGMSALKGSKFMGKKGTLSNAKKAFATVNKTVSALKKGKKVRRTGATGTIARATSKLPGISSIKVRK